MGMVRGRGVRGNDVEGEEKGTRRGKREAGERKRRKTHDSCRNRRTASVASVDSEDKSCHRSPTRDLREQIRYDSRDNWPFDGSHRSLNKSSRADRGEVGGESLREEEERDEEGEDDEEGATTEGLGEWGEEEGSDTQHQLVWEERKG
jgi:hypothetical protein